MNKSFLFALALLLTGLVSSQARAALTVTTYGFVRITNNSPVNTAAAYRVEVFNETYGGVTLNAGEVGFLFYNISGNPGSFIDGVYFDDGTLVDLDRVVNFAGVQYSESATPANLPAGNTLAVPFQVTQGFSADGDTPSRAINGVGVGEKVGIVFDLIGGQDYASVINALTMGLGLDQVGEDPFAHCGSGSRFRACRTVRMAVATARATASSMARLSLKSRRPAFLSLLRSFCGAGWASWAR